MEMIERGAMEFICNDKRFNNGYNELIRCKECKYCEILLEEPLLHHCRYHYETITLEDYCSKAERKLYEKT